MPLSEGEVEAMAADFDALRRGRPLCKMQDLTPSARIGANDLWIACHALAESATLVTHNTREFQRVAGLKVEDWA